MTIPIFIDIINLKIRGEIVNQTIKVGIFIRELRRSKGLSQAELGELLHITKKAVSRWETGRGLPDSGLLLPLSNILGVSVDEMLKGEFTISDEMDKNEIYKLETVNSFLKYCLEKRNLINSFIVTCLAAMLFIFSVYGDINNDTDFEYMGSASFDGPRYCEFSFLTYAFLILLIMTLLFALYRIIIFLQSKIKLKKG